MTTHDDSDSQAVLRHPVGMGLAGRFTLGLAILAVLFAAPATWFLLDGATKLNQETAIQSRRAMAETTGRAILKPPSLPEQVRFQEYMTPGGLRVLVGDSPIALEGTDGARLYRVIQPGDEEARNAVDLYAPVLEDPTIGRRLIVLVLMVTGGLVFVLIVIGAWTAQRVAAPLRNMIDDVLAISHGRLEHHVHVEHAVGEVAHLGRAVDRVVRDLVEGQEMERKLERRQREVEVLRELRRNLRPLHAAAPAGYSLETAVVEARGAGTGDFVDAMSDADGRLTVVVGSTATPGMPGALLMAMTRAYVRSATLAGKSPAEACDSTNTSLNRDLARGLYASAMVLRLDPATANIELVSAGHKAPALRWDADAGELRKLQPNGIALGFDQGPIFRKSLEIVRLDLHSDDGILLFSPVAFELEDAAGHKLGEKGIYALAKVAMAEGMPAMEKKLLKFLGGQPTSDVAFALLRHIGSMQ